MQKHAETAKCKKKLILKTPSEHHRSFIRMHALWKSHTKKIAKNTQKKRRRLNQSQSSEQKYTHRSNNNNNAPISTQFLSSTDTFSQLHPIRPLPTSHLSVCSTPIPPSPARSAPPLPVKFLRTNSHTPATTPSPPPLFPLHTFTNSKPVSSPPPPPPQPNSSSLVYLLFSVSFAFGVQSVLWPSTVLFMDVIASTLFSFLPKSSFYNPAFTPRM